MILTDGCQQHLIATIYKSYLSKGSISVTIGISSQTLRNLHLRAVLHGEVKNVFWPCFLEGVLASISQKDEILS